MHVMMTPNFNSLGVGSGPLAPADPSSPPSLSPTGAILSDFTFLPISDWGYPVGLHTRSVPFSLSPTGGYPVGLHTRLAMSLSISDWEYPVGLRQGSFSFIDLLGQAL